MMEARMVKKEDIEDLKEIWRLSFGDSDSFIDFYFQTRDWVPETAVLADDGKAVAMLTMIPVDMIDKEGRACSASMLYAIATHPDYQKRGFADRLIEFSNQFLLSKHTNVTLLVPASEELFRFYGKRGYRDSFYVREAILANSDIDALSDISKPCRITAIRPMEYNAIRRNLLNGHPYLDYRDDEISFQKQLARMSGTDLYAIITGDAAGCAYAERISDKEVIVKELIMPEPYLILAVKKIAELLPADHYTIRTPAHAGEALGGIVKPFGMIRANRMQETGAAIDSCFAVMPSYLGIAFD